MTTTTVHHEIIELLDRLSPEQLREVRDFANFLYQHRPHPARTHLKGSWLGSMSDLRSETAGVKLQHEANELRMQGALKS